VLKKEATGGRGDAPVVKRAPAAPHPPTHNAQRVAQGESSLPLSLAPGREGERGEEQGRWRRSTGGIQGGDALGGGGGALVDSLRSP
jgi:hypothetical protein